MLEVKRYNWSRYIRHTVELLLAVLLTVISAWPQPSANAAPGINEQLNYQARLLNSAGAVVPDGTYNIEFKIYEGGDGVIGGGDETLKWTETRESGNKVLVRNGYFSVYLGSVNPFGSSVDWNQDILWLSINIGGTAAPTYDGQMSPFTRFSSTPYALNSRSLGGLQSTQFVRLAQGVQADSSTTASSIFLNKTGATANILQLQRGGDDVLVVDNSGKVLLQNTSDAADAFVVQNSSSQSLMAVNTSTASAAVVITATTGSSQPALVVNNSTSTGNIAEFQDNGVAVLTIANGGTITGVGTINLNVAGSGNTSIGNSSGTLAINSSAFDVSTSGAVSGVTTFDASGLITGTGGATLSGATISLNASSNNSTNINTGSSTGTVTIGGGSAPLIINSTNFDVSSAGALSGITTINASGAIAAATANDTINGLVISAGNISKITGITMDSGNFDASASGGTFATTTGANTLNGNTTVAAGRTLTVTSALTTLTGATSGDALSVSNSTSTGNIAVFRDNAAAVLTIADGGGITGTGTYTFSGVTTDITTGTDQNLTLVANGTGYIDLNDTVRIGTLTPSRAVFTDGSNNLVSTGASADLANSLSNETGTGVAVFNTSPDFTTSITTGSSSFDLLNANATTLNFAGAATTLNIGATSGTTSVRNALDVALGITAGNSDAFSVATNGAVTAVGVNAGTGLLQGTGGLTTTGTASINASNNSATNINTGSSTGLVTIGGGSGTFSLQTTNIDISNTGAITGATGIETSGTVTLNGLTASRLVFTDASKNLVSSASSAVLLDSISDETGTGLAVFGTSPTISTSIVAGTSSFDLLDTTATTINFGRAATSMVLGAVTGTTSIRNALDVGLGITAGTGNAFSVNSDGDVTSVFTALNGTSTANGGSGLGSSTSLTLTSAANFEVGNYVQMNSNNCGGTGINPCYAKITAKSTNTLTITPALTWTNGSTVNEYHIPEIGGTNATSTLVNRYGRGYFISGVATGNGTTFYNEDTIESSLSSFSLLNTGVTTLNIGGAATTLNIGNASGTTTVSGTVNFSGNVTAPSTGTSGYLSRSGTTLTTANGGDSFTTSGGIATTGSGVITSAGLLTASNGLTVTAGGSTITSGNLTLTAGNLVTGATTRLTNAGVLQNITGITLTSGNLDLATGGIVNAGSVAGVTSLSASGNLSTSGNISATGTGTITSAGLLTASSGLTITSGGGTVTAGNFTLTAGNLVTGATTRLTNGGALQNITGLTLISGSIDVANGGITNTGSLAGVTSISATGAITTSGNISSTGTGTMTSAGLLTASTGLTITSGGGTVTAGNLTLTAGNLVTGATTRLTNAGALQNITGLTLISGAIDVANGGISNAGAIAGATTVTASGNINTTGGVLQTNSQTRVDNSGNLTNIGSLTMTGAVSGLTSMSFSTAGVNPAYLEGRLFYDNVQKALSYYNSEAAITMNIGQENYIYVYNNTGATITDGQVVYTTGSNVGVPTVALARADSATTTNAVGLATHSIENNTYGYVTAFGEINALDTSSFSAGATLYLSATTAGALTATRPAIPNYTVPVARVTEVNAATGKILVLMGPARNGAMTAGRLAFGGTDGSFIEDASLFWDNTNKRLALGGDATPDALLSVGATSQLQVNTSGNLTTSGTISTSGTGTITSAGLLTASTGLTITSGGGTVTAGNFTLTAGNLVTGATTRLTNAGALQNITGLTLISGNANLASGGIINTGSIAGATTIGASGLATLSGGAIISGADISLNASSNFAVNIATGTSTGTVTIGAGTAALAINSTAFDVTSVGAVSGVTTLTASGLVTLNGGLTIETGDTFTINGDGFTDLTSNGLIRSGTTLSLDVTTAGTVAGTGSNSGLIAAADGLSLLRGCANNEILKWSTTGPQWNCAADSTGISDARLKKNIVSIEEDMLNRIKNVKLYKFDYDCTHPAFNQMHCDTDRQEAGVMAQELAKVFPELVVEVNGYYRVRYDALGLYNLKAVGELAGQVDSVASQQQQNSATYQGDMAQLAQALEAANSYDEAQVLGMIDSKLHSYLMNGLEISGSSNFNGTVSFKETVDFVKAAVFNKDVSFLGRPAFNNDTGGFATIQEGHLKVKIKFGQPFATVPVVSVNNTDGQFLTYTYSDLTPEGFTIILKDPAEQEAKFSWTAFAINNALTIISEPEPETAQLNSSP